MSNGNSVSRLLSSPDGGRTMKGAADGGSDKWWDESLLIDGALFMLLVFFGGSLVRYGWKRALEHLVVCGGLDDQHISDEATELYGRAVLASLKLLSRTEASALDL